KPVSNGLRTRSIAGFLKFLPHVFQPNQSHGLTATYHFTFIGAEQRQVTIRIQNRTLELQEGLIGKAGIHVTADAKAWLGFVAKERSLIVAILTRKIRLKGDPRLLLAFGRCFPSIGPRRAHVEVSPQTTLMAAGPVRYQKNDPASGKIRWIGKLRLVEV